jgi:hypothetical protein
VLELVMSCRQQLLGSCDKGPLLQGFQA